MVSFSYAKTYRANIQNLQWKISKPLPRNIFVSLVHCQCYSNLLIFLLYSAQLSNYIFCPWPKRNLHQFSSARGPKPYIPAASVKILLFLRHFLSYSVGFLPKTTQKPSKTIGLGKRSFLRPTTTKKPHATAHR